MTLLRRIGTGFRPAILMTAGFIIWAWYHLGFFTFSKLVFLDNGSVQSMPNALATVDHPFHAARFHQFLSALSHGHVPRWIFSHQGGYPTEFYPFGSAAVDFVVWLATFGQMNVPMTHTWAVAIVFVLPTIAFFGIARLASLSPWIALIATFGHLCVRGWWWSGGSYELIEWGLITNVLASGLVFLALVATARILDGGSNRWLGPIILLIGWAEVTNPRSAVAVGTILLAGAIVWFTSADRLPNSWWRLVLPIGLGLGLAAPVLLPLFRYRDLYFFVNYSTYDNVTAWWHSSVRAVSLPFFVLGLIGCLIALAQGNTVIERLLAWAFLIYAGISLYLVQIDWPATWTEQLETTRLMPFQRLLTFSLAAVAVGRLAQLIRPPARNGAVIIVAAAIPLLYVWAPPSFIPVSDRGLVRIGTMAEPGIADLQIAVTDADSAAQPNTAMLVLGTTAFWHDHMWANLWTDRLLFYDDWLWYWQTQNVGDYDPLTEHAYPLDSSTISQTYLHTHGIGVVVVTGQARPFAATAPFLTRIRSGMYDVYTVNTPTTLATLDGQNLVSMIDDQAITIDGTGQGGTVLVRVNWFPRWKASGGLSVVHRTDGYMEITVPPGVNTVTLTYVRTKFDWLASLIALGCGAAALAFLFGIKPTARSAPRESSAPIG